MPKYIDISGQKFGRVTVLRRMEKIVDSQKRARYECLCDCGQLFYSLPDLLKRKHVVSCGHCLANKIIGEKFNKLTVLKFTGTKNRLTYVQCQCDCGNVIEKAATYVSRGIVKSCGCANLDHNLRKAEKLIGVRQYYLTPKKIIGKNLKGQTLLLCRCRCGNNTTLRLGDRNKKSCGCLQKEKILRGENQPNARLKNYEAEAIRTLYNSKMGYDFKTLSKMFKVDISSIRRIIKNQLYKSDS